MLIRKQNAGEIFWRSSERSRRILKMPGKIENQYKTLGLSKMNLRLYIICIAAVVLALLAGPALADITATVHGTAYRWDTFEPLDNAVVEVNSTPSQSMVAKYGVYSFNLMPGDYNITANYYENSSIKYSANENITVKDQGKYLVDLLLLPVYSEELMSDSELNGLSENPNGTAKSTSNTTDSLTDTSTSPTASKGNSSSMYLANQNIIGNINVNYLLIAVFLLLILLAAGYRISRVDKNREKNQPFKSAHKISGMGADEKVHTTRDFFKPVKVPEISVEVHDERVGVPHESLEPELKWDSQVQESRTKPFETSPLIEPIADPAKGPAKESITESLQEPAKESVAESLQEPVKEPVNEQVKSTVTKLSYGIPEAKVQEDFGGIKADSSENKTKLLESEPQKEKQGVPSEEAENKPAESSETETPVSRKKLPLPADLQEVMDIIRGQGGRITQKDLRSKLKYSEGKVSLMLADLERRELIEKFKRGRGNVVILRDEER
ncbi:hypothetical protein ASJ81_07295 [Methanosarcina spelaei]|uniref:DUF7343 domain-containing protein n=2 Tax=Methanosarcina spelaei TaxID=1036679 RepID=A0A2A2HSE0_9EURY|nr:hypothetical protein ASJ81_07295 [Methanosarcina spelaei]